LVTRDIARGRQQLQESEEELARGRYVGGQLGSAIGAGCFLVGLAAVSVIALIVLTLAVL
jgi:hypothetical protein